MKIVNKRFCHGFGGQRLDMVTIDISTFNERQKVRKLGWQKRRDPEQERTTFFHFIVEASMSIPYPRVIGLSRDGLSNGHLKIKKEDLRKYLTWFRPDQADYSPVCHFHVNGNAA